MADGCQDGLIAILVKTFAWSRQMDLWLKAKSISSESLRGPFMD